MASASPRRPVSKRLVIIGGAPMPTQLPYNEIRAVRISRFIDTSDYVIRMNNIKNHGSPWIGRKTDMLAVANTGRSGERYASGKLIRFGHLDPPSEIFWACTPSRFNTFSRIFDLHLELEEDLAIDIAKHQSWSGLQQHRLPALRELQLNTLVSFLSKEHCYPSTGIRALWYIVNSRRFAGYKKYFLGFGFKGWKGHDFDVEAKLVDWLVKRKKLHPLQVSDLHSIQL